MATSNHGLQPGLPVTPDTLMAVSFVAGAAGESAFHVIVQNPFCCAGGNPPAFC
jgi:uncharacterized protein (DUF849 family)